MLKDLELELLNDNPNPMGPFLTQQTNACLSADEWK
jgi:hypothetical protein